MPLGFLEVPRTVESVAWWIAGILGTGLGIRRFLKSLKGDNFIQIHSDINERLSELRIQSNAMRASIMQFHNGEYYMDGISMRKFSVSHESSYKGYYPQVLKFKNSLCSLFTVLLEKMMENKSTIHSVETLSDHGHTKHFFEDEYISHFSILPLKNKGIIVGFILVQWHKDYAPNAEQAEQFVVLFEDIHNSIQIDLARQKN